MTSPCSPLAILLSSAVMSTALAGTVLFDFETPGEIGLWHDENRAALGSDKSLTQVSRLAASGDHSMRFVTPAWIPEDHGGRQKWPAFEGTPPIRDWSGYDRLVFEIVNTTAAPQRLMLFITDSRIATRSGLNHREVLPPFGHVRAVVPIGTGLKAKDLDPADIQTMHLYTEDPPVDMVVHLDRFLLLKPGEPIPPPAPGFIRDVVALQQPNLQRLGQTVEQACARLEQAAAGTPALNEWVAAVTADLTQRAAELQRRAAAADLDALRVPADILALEGRANGIEELLSLRLGFETVRPKVQAASAAGHDVMVGFADAMTKVLPRTGGIPPLATTPEVGLSAAGNETESLQVIVLPFGRALTDVTVTVSELVGPDGRVLGTEPVSVSPVGYVETRANPPYGSPHIGWWPDPILAFMGSVDIAADDAQSFWLTVKPPAEQRAGMYRGELRVQVGGLTAFAFPFSVRVRGFSLPDASPLPMAITFAPHDHPTDESTLRQTQWRKTDNYPVNAWAGHEPEWAAFLADYYITMDSLYDYGNRALPWEQWRKLKAQGRLGRFNLGYYHKCGDTEEQIAGWKRTVIEDRLRPRYEKAKEMGLVEHAYIYGCDEHKESDFPQVQRAAALIKEAFPDVMVMTTTYDHSFGLDSVITAMDAFCPLTPRYDRTRAERARAAGKEVWWYICCGPRHPYANMFIEYPAIEGRLLMGAMTARDRPDGFLYYQISIWNSEKPITDGPFTDWDPRSWTSFHGDGSWTCVGPDGTPLPTIRLENFRDGLQDYAYARILDATIDQVGLLRRRTQRHTEWAATARAALRVPETLIKSRTEFTDDPRDVTAWRNGLAEAIENAPIAPVIPW